jgi:hypothetical protein
MVSFAAAKAAAGVFSASAIVSGNNIARCCVQPFGGVSMIGKERSAAQAFSTGGPSRSWVRGVSYSHSNFDEKALTVFQPDILIGTQYLATYRRRFHLDPERVLMLAVLEDAVVCFQENVGATCKRKLLLHDEAEEWIFERDGAYLFSFESICETLGFEASYFRQGLLRWKQVALAKSPRKDQRKSLAG